MYAFHCLHESIYVSNKVPPQIYEHYVLEGKCTNSHVHEYK